MNKLFFKASTNIEQNVGSYEMFIFWMQYASIRIKTSDKHKLLL